MSLSTFFEAHPKVALAFSGGTDSAYLLYAALQSGADVRAYTIHSVFQPAFELEDAKRIAQQLGAPLTILEAAPIADPAIAANTAQRCYHCKRAMLSLLARRAREDGYTTLLDGTNASDETTARPGMRALEELRVLSPLRECGLTKAEIRRLSKEAGLFTWNKNAYACLATRIPVNTPLTEAALEKTERAEALLFNFGFSDFRVRHFEGCARIQLPAAQFPLLMEKREAVMQALRSDYTGVLLDLEARNE